MAQVPFIVVAIATSAISIAVSLALAPDLDSSDVGTDVTKSGVQSPRNRVFGRCRASCTNVYSNVLDNTKSERIDIFAIAGIGRVKYIHQAWIEEKELFNSEKNISTDPSLINDGWFAHNDHDDGTGTPIQKPNVDYGGF